jgi:hypothetical protein
MAQRDHEQERQSWYASLEAALPNSNPDALKIALDHATKMLDNVYAANDAVSQKARWGIGLLMGVIVIGLKTSFDMDSDPSKSALAIPGIYVAAFAWLVLGLAAFIYVAFTKKHQHSGMEPFRYRLGEWITYAKEVAADLPADMSGKQNLEVSYVLLITLGEYQDRIDQERVTNKRISLAFDLGMACVVLGFGVWVAAFILNR